jgi:hypothetical protein
MVAAFAEDSKATSEQQTVAAPAADDAERDALDAEARDAANRALENARDEQK